MKRFVFAITFPFVLIGVVLAFPVAGIVGGFKATIDYLDSIL